MTGARDDRQARLAAALRQNLRLRKAQARAGDAEASGQPPAPAQADGETAADGIPPAPRD